MNSTICKILGKYFISLSLVFFIPLIVAVYYEYYLLEDNYLKVSATASFLFTSILSLLLGIVLFYFGRNAKEASFFRRESIVTVVLIWFMTGWLGSLPFVFTQTIARPIDAYFESISALTTTGASIIHPKQFDLETGEEQAITMENPLNPTVVYTFYGSIHPLRNPDTGRIVKEGIEALGKPLLFFRTFLQWLGGIGVVVLFLAILPLFGVGGKLMYESEVTGPTKEGITPRVKETTSYLLKIYFALTLALVLLLLLPNFGLSLFDAVTLAFATISTGGFVTQNSCPAIYLNNIAIVIVMLFMVLAGVNFSLYFHFLKKKIHRLYQPEFLYYLGILGLGSLLVFVNLWSHSNLSFAQTILYGTFQAISSQTSTGFAVISYDSWPIPCQVVLILLMYIGGMSGSTAGGLKVIRYIIIFKVIFRQIDYFFRPEAIRILKVGNKEISDKTAANVLSFFALAILLVSLGTYLLVLDGNDMLTAFSVISTTLNNNGLYFGGIGCTASLGFLSDFSKVVTIFWMVLGRLEFFSLMVLLLPSFWKNR